MLYNSAQEFLEAPRKSIALFGMSGMGKTVISNLLRDEGNWFHYSVDYRIATRYLDEAITDNFKREAMKVPFLRDLLMSDSIGITAKTRFHNLAPLSTWLGKPGDPNKGGIEFGEYQKRQALHADAERAATTETPHFYNRAKEIYGYPHFIADTSGSLCEVVDPEDRQDPVMAALARTCLPVWIRGTNAQRTALISRFTKAPKPMFYRADFLIESWQSYLQEKSITAEHVDPNDFIRWGYERLIDSRLPRYQALADKWGITINSDDLEKISNSDDFITLIAESITRKTKNN